MTGHRKICLGFALFLALQNGTRKIEINFWRTRKTVERGRKYLFRVARHQGVEQHFGQKPNQDQKLILNMAKSGFCIHTQVALVAANAAEKPPE